LPAPKWVKRRARSKTIYRLEHFYSRVSCTAVSILNCGITNRASHPEVTGEEIWLTNIDLL